MKNRFSRERKEARDALIELLNLPNLDFKTAKDDPRGAPAFVLAEKFIRNHGPLRPVENKLSTVKMKQLCRQPDDDSASWEPLDPGWLAQAELFEYGRRLRDVWTATKAKQFTVADAELTAILIAGDPIEGKSPAFTADIEERTVRREAKSLLQRLALELLYSHRTLQRCAVCKDFFVKSHNKQKTCRSQLRNCKTELHNRRSRKNMKEYRERQKQTHKKTEVSHAKRSHP